ncbi:MAG: TlpA disulfide reductase family protein [Balneola sp.]
MEKVALLIVVGLALSVQINAQKSSEPDSLYQEIIQKYKLEFKKIDHDNRSLTDSVGALRALELEELYNKYPQKNAAKKGLVLAFRAWLNVDSVAVMGKYVNQISFNDEIWHELMTWYSYGLNNSRTDPFKYFGWLEEILETESVTNSNSLTFLYSELGKFEMRINENRSKAIEYFENIIDLNADSVEVEMAKRDLYDLRSLQIGQKAPQFSVTDLEGNLVELKDYQGKYVLIEFWATWCGPCIPEIPYLKKAYENFGDREDFKMIGISLDTDRVKLKEFLEENEIKWTQILDEGGTGKWSGKLGTLFAVGNGIPKTFLIDKVGNIIATELRKEKLNEILSQHLE